MEGHDLAGMDGQENEEQSVGEEAKKHNQQKWRIRQKIGIVEQESLHMMVDSMDGLEEERAHGKESAFLIGKDVFMCGLCEC